MLRLPSSISSLRPHLPGAAALLCASLLTGCGPQASTEPSADVAPPGEAAGSIGAPLSVPRTDDFELSGDGSDPAWAQAAFVELARREGGTLDYRTRIKVLYSGTGVYVLMDATDRRLTATLEGDYLRLWTEDVFEAFFWTDEAHPIYFEYEISPLGYELPLIIPNFDGDFLGWIPWQYAGERRTRKAVAVLGGAQRPGASITGWRAEVFIPYALLAPLQNVPPTPGTRWRANFYRNDYDGGDETSWNWRTTGPSYHEFERFGTLIFE